MMTSAADPPQLFPPFTSRGPMGGSAPRKKGRRKEEEVGCKGGWRHGFVRLGGWKGEDGAIGKESQSSPIHSSLSLLGKGKSPWDSSGSRRKVLLLLLLSFALSSFPHHPRTRLSYIACQTDRESSLHPKIQTTSATSSSLFPLPLGGKPEFPFMLSIFLYALQGFGDCSRDDRLYRNRKSKRSINLFIPF